MLFRSKCCEDLKNYSQHIDKLIEKQTSKELENNQLRLKTSIECALMLHRISRLNASASIDYQWLRKAYKMNRQSKRGSEWTDQTFSDG